MANAEKCEKVVRGLECCIVRDPDAKRNCVECPYNHEGIITNAPCANGLMADALALLREQEPRVMTLEELQAIGTQWNRNTPPYIFVERRSFAESGWMSWGFMHDFVIVWGTINAKNYGSKWRVWTLQPTPEQMRETPWKGEKE